MYISVRLYKTQIFLSVALKIVLFKHDVCPLFKHAHCIVNHVRCEVLTAQKMTIMFCVLRLDVTVQKNIVIKNETDIRPGPGRQQKFLYDLKISRRLSIIKLSQAISRVRWLNDEKNQRFENHLRDCPQETHIGSLRAKTVMIHETFFSPFNNLTGLVV
jgi:hypothetical protein